MRSEGPATDDRLTSVAPFLPPLLIGGFFAVWLRTAWVCDDAFITFRTVDNLWHGFGPVYNVVERVQAYTHPLWMALVAALYGLSREPYFTALALAAACTLITLVLLTTRIAKEPVTATLGLLVLILSRAFVDYSSSGLENPLTHLLLVVFVIVWLDWREHATRGRTTALFALGSLTALTRPDAVLLVIPALAVVVYRSLAERAFRPILLGITPLIAWEAFSLFYYGSPIPNTALAKLATGIPVSLLVPHGFSYLRDALTRDPITPAAIGAGIALAAIRRRRTLLPLGLGVLAQLLFLIRIGGDFMSGRFLSAPFLLAVIILLTASPSHLTRFRGRVALAALAIVLLGLVGGRPTVLSGSDYGVGLARQEATGITDERARYYPGTGLLRQGHAFQPPNHPWVSDGVSLRAKAQAQGRQVVLRFAVGMVGYYAGPDVHIVDVHALTDPLLARLRCNQRQGGFRIGHFGRWVPGGYLESLRTGSNRITNRDLARYYDKLMLVTRGPLWARKRLETLVALNLGRYDAWLDAYRDPPWRRVPLSRVDRPAPPDRTRWDARGTLLMSRNGLTIVLDGLSHAPRLEVSLDRNDDYRLVFLRGEEPVGTALVEKLEVTRRGLATRSVAIPDKARKQGFDAVRIFPVDGDFAWSLGHLHLAQRVRDSEDAPDPLSTPRDSPSGQ